MIDGRPVAIDVFAGAGGLSEGLLSAGINVAVAIEKHPHPALTCAFNHPSTTVVCDDIAELEMDALSVLVRKRIRASNVDIVVGGPPCQGFSPAGLCNPNDPRNKLFREFVRVVDHFKPKVFLFENVPGFVKLYEGKAIQAIVGHFRELGYKMHGIPQDLAKLDEFPLLDASHFGVPQRRKRFILVGWREGEIECDFEWPEKSHGPDSQTKRKFVSTGQALSDLEFLTAGHESHIYQPDRRITSYQSARRSNTDTLFNHLATKHRADTVAMYRRLTQGGTIRMIPAKFRSGKQTMSRLTEWDRSKAVLALPDDFVHYRRHRIPTVREMARLQSFDDDFVFLGKRTTSDKHRRVDVPQYTQVGNAVPPLLGRALGKAILKCLGLRTKDLRDLPERKRRLSWIRGSSGFAGYSLDPDAKGKIDLVDNSGARRNLPLSSDDIPVEELDCITNWTLRPRRRSIREVVAP